MDTLFFNLIFMSKTIKLSSDRSWFIWFWQGTSKKSGASFSVINYKNEKGFTDSVFANWLSENDKSYLNTLPMGTDIIIETNIIIWEMK